MRYSPLILILLVTTSLFPIVQAQGTFWLSGWDYRIPFTLTANYDDVQANFSLTIPAVYFASVRVTEDDGVTLIPVWNQSATAIWARFPYANQTYYLYYGNDDAPAVYDAVAVFQRVIDSGVVLALPMGEGSGGTVYDYSGNSNHGTLGAGVTAPVWVSNGLYGDALEFDAVDDLVTVADHASLDVSAISMVAWVNNTAVAPDPDGSAIMRRESTYAVRFNPSGGLAGLVWIGAGVKVSDTLGGAWSVGAWRNVVFTYDNVTLKLFSNGSQVGSGVAQVGNIDFTANALGVGNEASGFYALGSVLSGCFIFDYALSQVEIDDFYGFYAQVFVNHLGSVFLRRWSVALSTEFGSVESSFSVEANNNLLAIGLLAVGASFTFAIVIVKRRNQ